MSSGRGAYSPLHAANDRSKQPKYVPLDLSTEEESEPNTNRRFLSGRRKYFVAGFAVVLIVSVVTLAAVLGTKSGIVYKTCFPLSVVLMLQGSLH